jgi:hypothetical protein
VLLDAVVLDLHSAFVCIFVVVNKSTFWRACMCVSKCWWIIDALDLEKYMIWSMFRGSG